MFDFENKIAPPILKRSGQPAVYEGLNREGQPVTLPLTVIFGEGFVQVETQGQKMDTTAPTAIGARSALRDVRKGGFLTTDGEKYLVASKPKDDSRVWITMILEGPLTDDD